jgi:3-hydroxyisobutyrate dehydrogenase-like beta-hydroxyacid dehydrogenase
MTAVAVLGTGKMGSAIARRLSGAGYEVTLWNRTPARAKKVGIGRVAPSAADAVASADTVITSLTGPEAVRATFAGPLGALASARGQHFIEMSTAGPEVLAELGPALTAANSSLVDAPILGPPTALEAGSALIVVGGADADVALVRPLLERFGEVRHVGPLGSGARIKLVANSLLGILTLAAGELQVAGQSAGLDPDVVFDVLRHYVPMLDARREGYLRDRHQPTLFALRDLRKDLDLALGLFHAAGASTPLAAVVRELIQDEMAEAADLDISAVIRRYRPIPAHASTVGSSGAAQEVRAT